MIRFSFGVAAAIAAWLPAAAWAQVPPAQPEFRLERPVVANGPGPRRLAIDVPLLAGGKPFQVAPAPPGPATGESAALAPGGLADLRLFDAAGREVSYLLVPNPPSAPVWKAAVVLPIAAVDGPTAKSSGFEADLGEVYPVDRFRLDGLSPPYLKRVRLEGSGDRTRWTSLVGEGTVFDLPNEGLRQTELLFRPGSFRYLRLTWDDTNSGRMALPPTAVARQVRTTAERTSLTTALVFERRPSEPGRSRFRVRLPGSRLPIVALALDVGGLHVLREASVFEPRLSGTEAVPTLLGRSTLRRVEQGALTAASLRVPISPPLEPQLDLVVEDGSNPPLDLRAVTAIFAELPWIYFESDGGTITARYGSPALAVPSYDLEAVRTSLRIDSVSDAAWGEAPARTAQTETNRAALPLPIVGSSLDSSLFRYLRAISPGDGGLVALPFDAAVLAHSAGAPAAFADVRVMDTAGRQIPYLVERASEPLSLDLALERLSVPPEALQLNRSTLSVYRVKWPFERLPSPRLVLTTSARVFERKITVGVEREPDGRRRDRWVESVATADWVHPDPDTQAPALILPLQSIDAKEVLVIVQEGDNSPLPLASAQLLLPAYRLRLFRQRDAALRLAYGHDVLSSPQYDLALLAPQVLGVAATEVALGPELETSAGSTPAALLSPQLFWGALIIAVAVLLVLIARLMRKENVGSA